MTANILVTGLTHDLRSKRSLVTLTWDDDPTRNLVLPVPFGTSLGDVRAEAEKVVRALSAEIGALAVRLAGDPAGP